ncbi:MULTISPECIES: tetratricopeptide repeat-containing sensor histidine kinase [Flavobacterium]|uniref:tetratricopeptide repeat-containing sensor histidine kinase n=1 Tax=Flavobacterium TaxID=237 RepID=UPI002114CDA3|nr:MULTISPECIES: tetratricopeptide repeat-containing sensor histidine kinase [Flavobacterium]UUF14283.1 ATP-binding protein [Flavobacterium panici]
MLRSPFFCFFIFLLFLSCEEKTNVLLKPNKNEKEAKAIQQKATEQFQKSNYNSAFYYFNKSKITFENLKDSTNVVYNLIQMGYIQQINGDYYGSKETFTEALPFIKKKDIYSAAINNFFGIADKELSIYDDAIFYYNQAINDSKDVASKQSPLNNIAVVYIKQKKYDKAVKILEGILETKAFDKFVKSKARVIDNLGFAYFKKGLNEKGLQLMNESLELRTKADDLYGSIESHLHLAEFYAKTNIQKSNENAKKAYEISTNLNSVDERLKALSFLISNGSGTKYAQQYISINDSIIKIRNNFKNKFAKIKYDSKKEKDENQKLRLEKIENELSLQKVKYQRIFFIIGIVSLFFLLLYLRKFYQNRNRIEKIKTAYDTETRIAKDIHDELANDVFNTITFTQTQPLEIQNTKETLLQKLDHIYSRVRGISRENNDIDTGSNYSDNLKEMLSTYNSDKTNVIITNIEKVNWDSIEDLKKIAIQRVLHELMVNMKKHSQAQLVVLKFENAQNTLLIDYKDNGKGCEKSKIIKNGLQNMENRILAIKGTITFETEPDKGFKVNITMPK